MPVRRGRQGRTESSRITENGAQRRNLWLAAILSPPILFVYAKLRNTTIVPRDLRRPSLGATRPAVCRWRWSMLTQRDHQVLETESGALWPALWVGAAVVAMVAFSYWLGMV